MNSTAGELIQERLPQWRAYAQSLTRNRAAGNRPIEDVVKGLVVRVDAPSDGERVEITATPRVDVVVPKR